MIKSPFRKLEQSLRVQKYRLFRYLPGHLGETYQRKYRWKLASQEFDRALLEVAGMTCIDLGANFGIYTVKMSKYAKRVIAFEPDPESLCVLEEKTAGYNNITIKNVAAGTKDKSVLLYRAKKNNESGRINLEASSLIVDKQGIDAEHSIMVRQIDFIRYLADLNERIGILKIDIEGAETELLEALFTNPSLVNRIKYIFCETHERFIPEHKTRILKLRQSSEQFSDCTINLDWH